MFASGIDITFEQLKSNPLSPGSNDNKKSDIVTGKVTFKSEEWEVYYWS
jgi:hypothetical protein